jgi:sulfur-oxidizing protein SoxY
MIQTSPRPAEPAPAYPQDPLGSPLWALHAETLFGQAPVRFDPRVTLAMPDLAENQHCFPVALDARGVGPVRRMVIFADLNPIAVAVDYRPLAAAPYLATRIKLDQRTPVRGAVLGADGTWLVSGGWVDAAGGGCSAPPVSRVRGDWAQHLGEMRGGAWAVRADGTARTRILIRHPMDTGFVAGIPAYNIERLQITSASGKALGEMDIWGSVSEDPAFTLMPQAAAGETLAIAARDSNGRDYRASLTVGALS